MNNTVVVIPALNPEPLLINYINELIDKGFNKIIIVNDGSSVECQPVFDQIAAINQCILLVHPKNRGKGRALKTAFQYFLSADELSDYDGVVTADADGQHSPHDTLMVAQAIGTKGKNFVLGCRDFDSDNVPFKSKKGNKITRNVMHVLFSKRITDTQTGLRGLNRAFVKDCLDIKGDRFEYEINMLILGMRTQNIVEIPIETIYFNQNRASSFKAVKDSLRIYGCIFSSFLKFCLASISSSVIDILLFNLITFFLSSRMETVGAIFYATIIARIFSSIYNYTVNRKVVFEKKTGRFSIVKYYALVVIIMMLSTILVSAVYAITSFDKSLIKIAVDTVLFLLSYKAQQQWVFK